MALTLGPSLTLHLASWGSGQVPPDRGSVPGLQLLNWYPVIVANPTASWLMCQPTYIYIYLSLSVLTLLFKSHATPPLSLPKLLPHMHTQPYTNTLVQTYTLAHTHLTSHTQTSTHIANSTHPCLCRYGFFKDAPLFTECALKLTLSQLELI